MQLSLTVKNILPMIHVGQNNTPKVSVVFEEITDREYKDSMVIDFLGEKTDLINHISVGDRVVVYFNFRASEYNGKFFNNISGRKLEKDGQAFTAPRPDNSNSGSTTKASSDEDMPF